MEGLEQNTSLPLLTQGSPPVAPPPPPRLHSSTHSTVRVTERAGEQRGGSARNHNPRSQERAFTWENLRLAWLGEGWGQTWGGDSPCVRRGK